MALNSLAGIAAAMPTLDAEAAKRARAAARLQVGQAMAQPPAPGVSATRAAQAVAPAAVGALANAEGTAAAAGQQALAQVGDAAAQETGRIAAGQEAQAGIAQDAALAAKSQAQQGATAAADRAQKVQFTKDELAQQERLAKAGYAVDAQLSFLTRKQREDLAKLGRDAKQELFDSRLAFEQDEQGRKFSNERQLADFTVASARSTEELKDRMQVMEQASNKELYLLKAAQAKLTQALSNESKSKNQTLDQETRSRIKAAADAMQRKIARREAQAKNKAAVIQGAVLVATAINPVAGAGVAGAAYVAQDQGAI